MLSTHLLLLKAMRPTKRDLEGLPFTWRKFPDMEVKSKETPKRMRKRLLIHYLTDFLCRIGVDVLSVCGSSGIWRPSVTKPSSSSSPSSVSATASILSKEMSCQPIKSNAEGERPYVTSCLPQKHRTKPSGSGSEEKLAIFSDRRNCKIGKLL